jgi:hypothetical protein
MRLKKFRRLRPSDQRRPPGAWSILRGQVTVSKLLKPDSDLEPAVRVSSECGRFHSCAIGLSVDRHWLKWKSAIPPEYLGKEQESWITSLNNIGPKIMLILESLKLRPDTENLLFHPLYIIRQWSNFFSREFPWVFSKRDKQNTVTLFGFSLLSGRLSSISLFSTLAHLQAFS